MSSTTNPTILDRRPRIWSHYLVRQQPSRWSASSTKRQPSMQWKSTGSCRLAVTLGSVASSFGWVQPGLDPANLVD
jgi:hypothetical protein